MGTSRKTRTQVCRKAHCLVLGVLAALCAVAFLGLAGSASAAVPTYSNGFESNTAGWFEFVGSGTIVRQPSGYVNPGGYGSGIPSASGGFHARLERGTCEDEPAGGGPAVNCPGPFTRWGGYNKTWTGGWTTQVDIYLDATYAQANRETAATSQSGPSKECLEASSPSTDPACKGTRFDFSSAVNNAEGNFIRDFGFSVSTGLPASEGGTCSGFTVNTGTNVNRAGSNPTLPGPNGSGQFPQCIATSGWYTFKHTFRENTVTKTLEALMEIIPVGSTTAVASWIVQSLDPISSGNPNLDVGCNRYGWFSDQEIYGLAIDNASMTGCGTPPCPTNPPKVSVRWHYSAEGSSGSWSVTKEAKCAQTLTMGPQAMEGALKVSPGKKIKAGYDFSLPTNKKPFTVMFSEGKVVFKVKCVSGKPPLEPTFTVTLPNQSYAVTNANWYPSGNQSSPLVYQGEREVPNLCSGGQLSLKEGGTFSTVMTIS